MSFRKLFFLRGQNAAGTTLFGRYPLIKLVRAFAHSIIILFSDKSVDINLRQNPYVKALALILYTV